MVRHHHITTLCMFPISHLSTLPVYQRSHKHGAGHCAAIPLARSSRRDSLLSVKQENNRSVHVAVVGLKAAEKPLIRTKTRDRLEVERAGLGRALHPDRIEPSKKACCPSRERTSRLIPFASVQLRSLRSRGVPAHVVPEGRDYSRRTL